MRFAVRVEVMPKQGISDPQGLTVERALPALGFQGIESVRVGKLIEFLIEAADEESATAMVEQASEKVLSNPVIEDYRFEVRALQETT